MARGSSDWRISTRTEWRAFARFRAFSEGGNVGDVIRARLKKQKGLRLKGTKQIAKAYSAEEKTRRMEATKEARSPAIHPTLMLALNAGLRGGEIKNLKWLHIDLEKKFLTAGRSKTEAGEGRTIPLNPPLQAALEQHAARYVLRFGRIEPDWYLFPFGRANHLDPTRPMTSIKTAWGNARKRGRRGADARFQAHNHNRTLRGWRRRPDDHGHRRSRFPPDAEAL